MRDDMRLIDADALLEKECCGRISGNDVRNAPTIDAEPVRHGQLISTGTDELYCEWGDCTVCGSDNRINSKFCNNCGAKIEGVVSK